MPTSEIIFPAVPGTHYLCFEFFASVKASETQVKERMIKRPVLAWRLEAGRPMPIVAGVPIEIDLENFEGVQAVIVPGSGLILDCLTGRSWGSDEIFMRDTVKIWGGWLREKHPQPVAAPQAPARGTVYMENGRVAGFVPG